MPPLAAGVDLTTVLVALLGGGLFSGIGALLRFKPEKDAVVVSAAQGAVIVQSGVIDALQEELARERQLRKAAEARVRELERRLRDR